MKIFQVTMKSLHVDIAVKNLNGLTMVGIVRIVTIIQVKSTTK